MLAVACVAGSAPPIRPRQRDAPPDRGRRSRVRPRPTPRPGRELAVEAPPLRVRLEPVAQPRPMCRSASARPRRTRRRRSPAAPREPLDHGLVAGIALAGRAAAPVRPGPRRRGGGGLLAASSRSRPNAARTSARRAGRPHRRPARSAVGLETEDVPPRSCHSSSSVVERSGSAPGSPRPRRRARRRAAARRRARVRGGRLDRASELVRLHRPDEHLAPAEELCEPGMLAHDRRSRRGADDHARVPSRRRARRGSAGGPRRAGERLLERVDHDTVRPDRSRRPAEELLRPPTLPGSAPPRSAGKTPARTSDDLPLPDAPTTRRTRTTRASRRLGDSRSRPKKNSASSPS